MDNTISWPHQNIIEAYWAQPGTVLAGEYPGDTQTSTSRAKLTVLLEAGVLTFIDLTTDSEALPSYVPLLDALATETGVDVTTLRFPTPVGGVLGTDGYNQIVAAVNKGAERGGVYVHDRRGLDRVAVVVGCMFIDSGLSYEGAMRTIKERRASTPNADTRAPQGFPQREVLQQRAERHLANGG